MRVCPICGYDMRAHENGSACPECGRRSENYDTVVHHSPRMAWVMIATAAVLAVASILLHILLVIDRREFDPLMRILMVLTHANLALCAVLSIRQLKGISPRKHLLNLALATTCGFLPGFSILLLIAGLIFSDIYSVDYRIATPYLVGLIAFACLCVSAGLILTKPRREQLYVSFALPMASFATSLFALIAGYHYF